MLRQSLYRAVVALASSTPVLVAGLNISTDDADALSVAVKQVSNGVLSFYAGDSDGIGIFPDPYYWWESGEAWDTLVNYWYLTGDASHNAAIQAALVNQDGVDDDYLPTNQTKTIMNDDQMAWALAAMTAAERGFPVPVNQTNWEDKAKTVFQELTERWDTASCDGGLRWGIFTFNSGYDYKNSISQAMFFQLAARLARFTGNQTYVDWATKVYDWTRETGLISDKFVVYDGASSTDNCTNLNHIAWSFPSASFAYGSAVLANMTSNSEWVERTKSHVENIIGTFFPDNIMTEVACETNNNCNVDQLVFPALTLRWLALVPVFQPATVDAIYPALNASAIAAASRCTVSDADAAECRNRWSDDEKEGKTGLGQQLAALEALQSRYLVSKDGANSSVVLRSVNSTSASDAGSGSGGNGTATSSGSGSGGNGTATSSGSAASASGTSAAGSVEASWGVLVAMGLAMACFL